MKRIRSLFWLSFAEWREAPVKSLCSFLFFAAMGADAGILHKAALDAGSGEGIIPVAFDFLMLVATGVLGFGVCSPGNWKYWKTHALSKRMAFLRSLPMRIQDIAAARFLVFGETAVLSGTAFFGAMGLVLWLQEVPVTTGDFIRFSLLFLGYTGLLGGIYLIGELGYKESIYLKINLAIGAVLLAVSVLGWAAGLQWTDQVLRLAHTGSWLYPLVSFAIGCGSLFISYHEGTRRLRSRSLD